MVIDLMTCYDKDRAIFMTRGTTYTVAIRIKNAGELYRLSVHETLRFGVKRSADEKTYLIQKDIHAADFDEEAGCYYITILPADTEALELGQYSYDIGIQPDEINYYIISQASPFVLSANITGRIA